MTSKGKGHHADTKSPKKDDDADELEPEDVAEAGDDEKAAKAEGEKAQELRRRYGQ